jgi:hypothetical protein
MTANAAHGMHHVPAVAVKGIKTNPKLQLGPSTAAPTLKDPCTPRGDPCAPCPTGRAPPTRTTGRPTNF